MKRILLTVLILACVAVLERYMVVEAKPVEQSPNFDRFANWDIDGVRPGMSLAEAKSIWGGLDLTWRADFFGLEQSLYRRKSEGDYQRSYLVVNRFNQVVQVQGHDLREYGVSLTELPENAAANICENRCRATDLLAHAHRVELSGVPFGFRGPVAGMPFLGEDPEWLSLCYRTDDLGVCLEALDHISSLVPKAKARLGRYATTLEELPEYRKDAGILRALTCPLGEKFRIKGSTLTCNSHPGGPISVTSTDKFIKFWRGEP